MSLTERDLEHPDPLRLSREIERVATGARRWARAVRRGEGLDEDPFVFGRLVTGRTAFTALTELAEADPLRTPLRRWVFRLAQARINRTAIARVAMERQVREHVVSEPEQTRAPLAALIRRALAEPVRRQAWLGSYQKAAGGLADIVAILWERRQEIATRFGLPGPDPLELPGPDVVAAATAWLDRTEDAFADLAPGSLEDLVSVALGAGAEEGWPRHLAPSTLLDWFRETDLFRSLELDPGPLPEPYGPASFARALARVGAAWVDATAPRDQPFVVAHDPYGLRRRTMGAALGVLPGTPSFARRALGLSGERLQDHTRALARGLLFESRAAALRVVLRSAALAGRRAFREAFEAEAHRALHLPLRPALAGALFRLHEDDAQRFAGMLLAAQQTVALRDLHDDDWYRNPRAIEQLRDEAKRSPETTTTKAALLQGANALYDNLSNAIG